MKARVLTERLSGAEREELHSLRKHVSPDELVALLVSAFEATREAPREAVWRYLLTTLRERKPKGGA